MARQFSIIPGKREALPLFIGLVGPSSSGKTRSAFELATGIQSVVGGEIVFINTEGKRGLLDIDLFKKMDRTPAIQHMPFAAPYASLDYLDAILQARESGAKTIIIDSLSHEHEAEGGMLDYWEAELERMAGDDQRKRYAMQMLAIAKPKAARRRLLTRGIMQADVNVIACFRAKETSKPVKAANGKNEVVNMGFVPVAGDEFVYEMSLSCLLLPGANGYPTWAPEHAGEIIAVKPADPEHELRRMIPQGRRLSRDVGADLARWARGAEVRSEPESNAQSAPQDTAEAYSTDVAAFLATAGLTNERLEAYWKSTERKQRVSRLLDSGAMTEEQANRVKAMVEDMVAELKKGAPE